MKIIFHKRRDPKLFERLDGPFLAKKPKRGTREKLLSVKANRYLKRMNLSKSEFFGSLDFLVTFLAMKKVTGM